MDTKKLFENVKKVINDHTFNLDVQHSERQGVPDEYEERAIESVYDAIVNISDDELYALCEQNLIDDGDEVDVQYVLMSISHKYADIDDKYGSMVVTVSVGQ